MSLKRIFQNICQLLKNLDLRHFLLMHQDVIQQFFSNNLESIRGEYNLFHLHAVVLCESTQGGGGGGGQLLFRKICKFMWLLISGWVIHCLM